MKMTQELLNKVKKYQAQEEKSKELFNEIVTEIATKTNIESEIILNVFVADKPAGRLQLVDEYCDQKLKEDKSGYEGIYYHAVENSKEYIAFDYETDF